LLEEEGEIDKEKLKFEIQQLAATRRLQSEKTKNVFSRLFTF